MKSITARFTALVIAAILLSIAAVGGVSMVVLRDKVDTDAESIINLNCDYEAQRIDAVLSSIQQSVDLEAAYALELLSSTDRFFSDETYRKEYDEQIERLCVNVANETNGVVAFYFRHNADEIDTTDGFLYVRGESGDKFDELPPTDISLYDPDDDEHVGWYYIPLRNGAPTWMEPYHNENLGIYMISYVIPVYSEGRFIGVIGMDVDFEVAVNELKDIKPYESGYAMLLSPNAMVYYHPDFEYGTMLDGSDETLPNVKSHLESGESADVLFSYSYGGMRKKLSSQSLINGMELAIVADENDINADRNRLLFDVAVVAIAILLVFSVLAIVTSRLLLRPLRELTEAAEQVSQGNLNVQLSQSRLSELTTLVDAYRSTVDRLREQMNYIEELARRDGLTKLLNKNSYDERIWNLDGDIMAGGSNGGSAVNFALVVVDVNDLKYINDAFGHERGNDYLLNVVKLMRNAFPADSIYRIGGDEFVIIVEGEGVEALDEHLARLEAESFAHSDVAGVPESRQPWNNPSVAVGAARFEPSLDHDVTDVFNRADAAMYAKKQAMKS